MLVTKLGHSCVRVDLNGKVAIFDPGVWSTHFNIDNIDQLDEVIITHQHPDHFDLEKIEELAKKFPELVLIGDESIQKQIRNSNIHIKMNEESSSTKKFDSPHEKLPIPGALPPTENGYHFEGQFTSPGDSHSFNETMRVLAMPFIAPWGKTGNAVNLTRKLNPDYVLPIHDWHYKTEAKEWLDGLLEKALAGTDIKLLPSTPGKVHEVSK